MVSCSWSLNLAVGFPQSVLQVSAFKSRWYCSCWFCNCETLFSVKLEIMADHHKGTEREITFLVSYFWKIFWEISGTHSCCSIGDCSFCSEGRKTPQALFSSVLLHLIRPYVPLSFDNSFLELAELSNSGVKYFAKIVLVLLF